MIVTSNFSTVISLIRGFHSSGCDYYFSANSCPLIANNWVAGGIDSQKLFRYKNDRSRGWLLMSNS
jgi:hypothetical protein